MPRRKWTRSLWRSALLVGVAVTPIRSDDDTVRSLDHLPTYQQAALRDAEAAFRAGDWQEAQIDYASLLREEPDFRRALWGRAAALLRLGRDHEAVPLLERALGPEPSFEELATAASLLDSADRRSPSALRRGLVADYRRRALDAAPPAGGDPASVDASRQLAELLLHQGDAVQAPEAAAALDRLGDRAPHLLAVVLDAAVDPASPTTPLAPTPPAPPDDGAWDHVQTLLVAIVLVGLAWAAGLLVLFVAGKSLSLLVLRWIHRDRLSGPIPTRQRFTKRVYAAVIALAGLYYYASLLVIMTIVLAAPGGFFYGLAATSRIPGWSLWAAVPICLIVLVLAVPMARSLRVRFIDSAPGRPFADDEAPKLWALAREVAEAVGTRPVDEIRLAGGLGIGVIERGRPRDVLRGRGRRSLLLGMGTFDDFSPVAFRAILAHEYGHFLHGDTAGGRLARRIDAQMAYYAQSIFEWRGNAWWNVGWHFLRFYHLLFRQITLGASRLQELHADGVMMRVSGPAAAAAGLRHMVRSEGAYQMAMTRRFDQALFGPRLFFEPLRLTEAIENRWIRGYVEAAFQTPTQPNDTHPSLASRLARFDAAAERSPELPPSGDAPDHDGDEADGGLWDQFAYPDRIRAEYRRRCDIELQARLDDHTAYHDQVIAACTATIHDNPHLAPPYFHRAESYAWLGDQHSAIADYGSAIERSPSIADPYVRRAFALSRLGRNQEAIADVELAIRRDRVAFEPIGRAMLGDLYVFTNRLDRAVAEYDRALELVPSRADWRLKRGRAQLALNAAESALLDFDQALELDPESVEALISRGEAHLALGDFAAARREIEAALKLDPILAEAHRLLSSLLETDPDVSARDPIRAEYHRRRSEALDRRRAERFHPDASAELTPIPA